MCTAVSWSGESHYFGRNLDLEHVYAETVTVTPRRYPFRFASGEVDDDHAAMVGVATVMGGVPLYYDAVNEHGLGMAGLNFVGNAHYFEPKEGKINLAPHELIPWILGKYKSVREAADELHNINVWERQFHPDVPCARLHWMIVDRRESLVVESMADGLHVHQNPAGVLTNNPPFDFQLQHLALYLNVTAAEPQNRFSDSLLLEPFSRGMGGMGLPGDLSSTSRFVRAAFARCNAVRPMDELASVHQFFHILNAVEQIEGCVAVGDSHERTQYSSCCDTARGIYYYKTYENSQIMAVSMHRERLDGKRLISHPLWNNVSVRYLN
ncbi:MAG: choloylglycine hydrolase [Clostridia bacterium]|nr:choloylglycine hydrolase [Clostridia bacterium]